MKRLTLAIALLFAGVQAASATVVTYTSKAAFLAATSGLTLVDFEAQQVTPPVSFVGGGVLTVGDATFTQPSDRLFVLDATVYGTNTSNYLNNNGGGGGIGISFATPTYAVGMDIGCLFAYQASCGGADTMTLSTGDVLNFTDTGNLQGTGVPMGFFGFISTASVSSLSIADPNFTFMMDNVLFGAVPEPASLALLGLGLAGLGFGRRRKA